MKIIIIIPAYNEDRHIGDVVKELKANPKITEVLVIDDGSSDKTTEKAKAENAFVITKTSNQGKGAAINTGIAYAVDNNFDAAIFMDADGQHAPNEVDLFIDKYTSSGSDCIIGNRLNNSKDMPIVRYLTNKLLSFLISIAARAKISDSQCGYRLVSINALKEINLKTSRFDTESEMLVQLGRKKFNIDSVQVKTIYGAETSHIHPVIDTLRFIKFIIKHII